ncbi:uncharacterized protein [Amphiura filiformis]|uniref:uncharacterized protein n=1 Tax=Amphiura filiformis TaxID=82378 RepID=UPI003B21C12C
MSMTDHVKATIKSVNFHLRNVYRIRRFITIDSCYHLVRTLILSRLDYAHSLMFGTSSKDRKKLQQLQNRAARIVFRTDRYHPSAPLLDRLHWLPVEKRVVYKVLLLTFKCLNGLGPSYLTNTLAYYSPVRSNLRSENKQLLQIPRTRRTYGDNAFRAAAPRLWNAIPTSMRKCNSVCAFK